MHIITLFRSTCHLYESEPFHFRLARAGIHASTYVSIVLNYVNIDRNIFVAFICFFLLLSYLLHYHCHHDDHHQRNRERSVVIYIIASVVGLFYSLIHPRPRHIFIDRIIHRSCLICNLNFTYICSINFSLMRQRKLSYNH